MDTKTVEDIPKVEHSYQDIKKLIIEQKEEQRYFILPNNNKNWEKNKYFLEQISEGCVKDEKDLINIFQQMHGETTKVNNLIKSLQLKTTQTWAVEFIPTILPFIANLALQVEKKFNDKDILILETEKRQANHLTREQTAILLANMFFMTLSEQEKHDNQLPATFDFKDWITSIVDKKRNESNIEKTVCLVYYFTRIYKELTNKDNQFQSQIITYERLINENQDLLKILEKVEGEEENKDQMSEIEIVDNRGIESFTEFESIHCDFANRFLGGGVLRTGCVQEEIMFSIAPELIVGMLFCEKQSDNDAILITGAERFCNFSGYAEQFRFVSPYHPLNKVDEYNRKKTYTLAMNAIPFKSNPFQQYQEDKIQRELIKSFIGFQGSPYFSKESSTIPIVTGNWGCGVYKGDPQLKLIIQWISASLLKRKLYYCSFKAPQLKEHINVISLLKNKSIKSVMDSLLQYSNYTQKKQKESMSLFNFILNKLK